MSVFDDVAQNPKALTPQKLPLSISSDMQTQQETQHESTQPPAEVGQGVREGWRGRGGPGG